MKSKLFVLFSLLFILVGCNGHNSTSLTNDGDDSNVQTSIDTDNIENNPDVIVGSQDLFYFSSDRQMVSTLLKNKSDIYQYLKESGCDKTEEELFASEWSGSDASYKKMLLTINELDEHFFDNYNILITMSLNMQNYEDDLKIKGFYYLRGKLDLTYYYYSSKESSGSHRYGIDLIYIKKNLDISAVGVSYTKHGINGTKTVEYHYLDVEENGKFTSKLREEYSYDSHNPINEGEPDPESPPIMKPGK